METPPWYVLTGGPSSGKSSLVAELASRGYRTVQEAARHIIEKHLAAGKDLATIRGNARAFQLETLALKLDWEAALSKGQIVFLDRGIPDTVAYYKVEGITDSGELERALSMARYRKVFVLDLISKDKFVLDGARSETWEKTQELDRLLEEAYRSNGFDVLRVPALPLKERADFVLANL